MKDWARQRGFSDRQILLEWTALLDYVAAPNPKTGKLEVVTDWFLRWRIWWKTTKLKPTGVAFQPTWEAMREDIDAVIAKERIRGAAGMLVGRFRDYLREKYYDAGGNLKPEVPEGFRFHFLDTWKAWEDAKDAALEAEVERTSPYSKTNMAKAEAQRKAHEEQCRREREAAAKAKIRPRKGGKNFLVPTDRPSTKPPLEPCDAVYDLAAIFETDEEQMHHLWRDFWQKTTVRESLDWGAEFQAYVRAKFAPAPPAVPAAPAEPEETVKR
jgi:hypothetical protein